MEGYWQEPASTRDLIYSELPQLMLGELYYPTKMFDLGETINIAAITSYISDQSDFFEGIANCNMFVETIQILSK